MTDENGSRDVQPAIVKVFGRTGCAAAYAVRDLLHRCDVPFGWIELKTNEQARTTGVDSINDSRLPVFVFPDGARMQNPSIRQITEKLGWFRDPSRSEYDVTICGAGPAGLSAAVYASNFNITSACGWVTRISVAKLSPSGSLPESLRRCDWTR